jgi:hypothetical protein
MFNWFYEPSSKGKGWSAILLVFYTLILLVSFLDILIKLYLYGDWKHTNKVQGKVIKIFNCKYELTTNPVEKLYISFQNLFRNIDGEDLLSETTRSCAAEVSYQIKKQSYTSITSIDDMTISAGDQVSISYDPKNFKDITLKSWTLFDSTFLYSSLILFLMGCFTLTFFYFQNY